MRGMGNMNNMMKQMQKMQKKMVEAQSELETEVFEGTASNGLVKVIITGKKEIKEVVINPEIVDPDDVELLQDMIIIATNDAIKKMDEKTNSTMGQFTQGLNIPGL
ncbi:YbaB/EbfC family nucleoid-associated protein [Kurthia sibirica]|uniref:Nucleoid-associated protein DEX24_16255 n=1 Tax=Kurthia sibirica TaxID=202750 RepID=A0A2U3AFF4_9BACL|nr:YbaB/EbfC family nucleoid-associated protein [Kurthia sibirica]PWI23244.1 YbaB/EbfC family nucleoid-associated protein [Kurthia sibirica]GEK35657.1 nucleoid-associated protein [Kurthia sibirica]